MITSRPSGNLRLDRSRPDVVMVVTDANATLSLSGATPLAAARD